MRLLAAFDISVLSTHFEGLPLALLESMAQAKPMVATAVDGIPEVIVDGVNGFLTPHEDAPALAGRLIELIQSPSLAERLGQAARQTVISGLHCGKICTLGRGSVWAVRKVKGAAAVGQRCARARAIWMQLARSCAVRASRNSSSGMVMPNCCSISRSNGSVIIEVMPAS